VSGKRNDLRKEMKEKKKWGDELTSIQPGTGTLNEVVEG